MKNFLGKLYVPVVWTIFIEVLFCLPGQSFPGTEDIEIANLDKLAHMVIFAIFVASWCLYFKSRTLTFKKLKIAFFLVFLAACFNGIIIEYIQKYFITNRSFDNGDILADILSSGISYGVCNVMLLDESRNNSTTYSEQPEAG